jgi:integrase
MSTSTDPDSQPMGQCTGTTRAGEQCLKRAVTGAEFCAQHSPGRATKKRKSRRRFGMVRRSGRGRFQASYIHQGGEYKATHTFATVADADAWLVRERSRILNGTWIDPTAGVVALGEYAKGLLDRRSDLRPATRAKYASLLRVHIKPTLGGVEVAKITPSQVRDWYHALAQTRPTTADDSYRYLRAIFNTAVADGVVGRNPCQVRGAGQVRSGERPVATIEELVAAVAAFPDRYKLAPQLAAWCQLRRGEILGLQRRDFDLLHRTVRVERAFVQPTGQKPVLGPPKTIAGLRTLALPPNLLSAIEEHLGRFVGAEASAWAFATESGSPLTPNVLTHMWAEARVAARRPDLTFHDIRHSGLTWAAASGASVAELMRRGGHANPRAALRYQHATDDRDRVIADALGRMAEMVPVATSSETA